MQAHTLKDVNLDNNWLSSVPDALFALPNLKKLSLKNNQLSELGLAAMLSCGKKLATVSLDKNPLAFPPQSVAQRGWGAVKKWAAANSSYVVYRLLYAPAADGSVAYTDICYSGVRDPLSKEKDEDRLTVLVRPLGAECDLALPCIDYAASPTAGVGGRRDPLAQTGRGWVNMPFAGQSHVLPISHLYCGVFDGHGGTTAADALAQRLHGELEKARVFAGAQADELPGVLREVFLRVDKDMCKSGEGRAGSTCVTLTLRSTGEMVTAHAGDSRAIARVAGKPVELTRDHDVSVSKEERARVEQRGGEVVFHKGCWRVNKKLGVSRAFGDRRMKKGFPPVIDAEPDVSMALLSEECDTLIVASDGLFHFLDNKTVLKLAGQKLSAEESTCALMDYLIDGRRTQLEEHDNVTICLFRLSHGRLALQGIAGLSRNEE